MNTEPATTSEPLHQRTMKRQADPTLFANKGAGILLHFEDPAVLALLREAVESTLQPANDIERLLAERVARDFMRSFRHGNLETAAIDAEMADHQDEVEGRWGKTDPESLYHLTTRDPSTRAAIREYSQLEAADLRRLKENLAILVAFKKLP